MIRLCNDFLNTFIPSAGRPIPKRTHAVAAAVVAAIAYSNPISAAMVGMTYAAGTALWNRVHVAPAPVREPAHASVNHVPAFPIDVIDAATLEAIPREYLIRLDGVDCDVRSAVKRMLAAGRLVHPHHNADLSDGAITSICMMLSIREGAFRDVFALANTAKDRLSNGIGNEIQLRLGEDDRAAALQVQIDECDEKNPHHKEIFRESRIELTRILRQINDDVRREIDRKVSDIRNEAFLSLIENKVELLIAFRD